MTIKCPQCSFGRDVGDVRIPDKGVMATCPKCNARFPLKPERPAATTYYQTIRTCPSCFYTHSPGETAETCPQCGLVYAKHLERQRPARKPTELQRKAGAPEVRPERQRLVKTPAELPTGDKAPDADPERQRHAKEPTALPWDDEAPLPSANAPGWRRLLRHKVLIGTLAAALVAIAVIYGHDWKLDSDYRLIPSAWQGEMTYYGKQQPFILVIESAEEGKLEGYMDWVGFNPRYRLAIRGTYTGNHLLFEDYKFLERTGTTGLHDWQDVYIADNVMSGTAKNGNADLHAIKMETVPPK